MAPLNLVCVFNTVRKRLRSSPCPLEYDLAVSPLDFVFFDATLARLAASNSGGYPHFLAVSVSHVATVAVSLLYFGSQYIRRTPTTREK